MNEAQRKKEIERRKRESPYWAIVHTLGSLKLALTLLATIAIACAVATVYESKLNAQVAQAYIYKAPWFLIWLGVLCINLAAAALTRWPWQKKHTGFIVTHAGIIILLIGAMIGMKAGFEASVTLQKDAPSVNRLILNETIIQVDSPQEGAMYLLPLPVETRTPTPENPRALKLPHTDSKLLVDRYSEFVKEVETYHAAADGGIAVNLEFSSSMMGQSIPVSLYLEDGKPDIHHNFFGQAEIILASADGANTQDHSHESPDTSETYVVFTDKAPVLHVHSGDPSGMEFRLIRDEDAESEDPVWLLLARRGLGQVKGFQLEEVLGKAVEIEGKTVKVMEFWPDFVMKNGKPSTVGDEPLNPAVMLMVTGSSGSGIPNMFLNPTADGHLKVTLTRNGETYNEATVAKGDSFAPGWADWQVKVEQFLPVAGKSVSLEAVESDESGTAIPGIRARLVDDSGKSGNPVWIRSGRAEELFTESEVVRLGFGLRTKPVPFSIDLISFEVPRDEGTDQPADFISQIKFTDLESGESVVRTSRMNHPASYPGKWWNVMTGINYKFSQASWNPENLDETTLQVLFDPGWLFKWIGSLMICTGILIMFYFKPYSKNRKPLKATPQKENIRAVEDETEKTLT